MVGRNLTHVFRGITSVLITSTVITHWHFIHEPVELFFVSTAFCIGAKLSKAARTLFYLIFDFPNTIVLGLLKLIEYDVIAGTENVSTSAAMALARFISKNSQDFVSYSI